MVRIQNVGQEALFLGADVTGDENKSQDTTTNCGSFLRILFLPAFWHDKGPLLMSICLSRIRRARCIFHFCTAIRPRDELKNGAAGLSVLRSPPLYMRRTKN